MKFGKILGEKRFTTEDGTKVRMIYFDKVDIQDTDEKMDLRRKHVTEVTFMKIGNEFKIIDKHESTD